MLFKRTYYLDKLIRHKQNHLIKVITGIRRSGKSFLLFDLFVRHLAESGVADDHIIRIALDDRMNIALRDPDKCLEYIRTAIKDTDMYYVLIDEVQLMSEFEDVLNSLLHIRNADVYVTGSNSRFLSTDIITEFRGRGLARQCPICNGSKYGNSILPMVACLWQYWLLPKKRKPTILNVCSGRLISKT